MKCYNYLATSIVSESIKAYIVHRNNKNITHTWIHLAFYVNGAIYAEKYNYLLKV